MEFKDDDILITPGHQTRKWQSADYSVGRTHLFHERTYVNSIPSYIRDKAKMLKVPGVSHWAAGGSLENTEQWFSGLGTKEEVESLAKKHGGSAREEFYPANEKNPFHFLAFNDTEKALAFCRTKDFDDLCRSLKRLPENEPGETDDRLPRPGSVLPPEVPAASEQSKEGVRPSGPGVG